MDDEELGVAEARRRARERSSIRRWVEGPVDAGSGHLRLTVSPQRETWDGSPPVARIAPPQGDAVTVEFLVDRADEQSAGAVALAIREIEFYLLERGEEDAWGYACYHCGTMANICSQVNWSCVDPRREPAPDD